MRDEVGQQRESQDQIVEEDDPVHGVNSSPKVGREAVRRRR